ALERVLLAALDASGEDLKSAASFALGGVAAGNRARFLPTILAKMDEMPTHRYSLLCSLGEVIRAGEPEDDDDDDGGGDGDASSAAKTAQLSDAELDQILDVLFKNAGSDEEGVRNVTAECLGRLAARRPTRLLPELTSRLDPALHPDASTRVTAVTAVKHLARAVAKRKDAVLSALVAPCLASCVVGPNAALSDEDVGVRRVLRAAAQTLSAAAHADATLVTPSLPDALPALIAKTEILKDLVRVVDLGPFKHTVDDGLDLRKAAFECLDTLLDACLHPTKNAGAMTRLGAAAGYLDALTSGLGDQYDVKMVAHAVLVKLCRGDAKRDARERLAALCEPMKKTLTAKLKSDA
ncbi:uncharacterized protein MICPUCDRAFT_5179, partial [Micromonas pusilla CCMP1545]